MKSSKLNRVTPIILLLILLTCPLKSRVKIRCSPTHFSVIQGEKIDLHFELDNRSDFILDSGQAFFISYHIYDFTNRMLSYDNRRFSLPLKINRDQKATFTLPMYFSYRSGSYKIEIDIVKEGAFWGSQRNWDTAQLTVTIRPLISKEFRRKFLNTYFWCDNQLINHEQFLLRMIIKNCEIKKNGRTLGFSPGSTYPWIWIRDTSTFIHYAKYFYPLPLLAKIVERFLNNQKSNGEIVDRISINGNTDKNTVETDQESCLVLAAFEILVDDINWFNRKIRGKTIGQRLEMALEWVWNEKRDPDYQLITSGFTADWGDVEISYSDQRATKLSDRSIPVLGIYTQSKYIQALNKLIKILDYMNKSEKAKKWRERVNLLRALTKKNLYLKDKGYFITHIVPSTNRFFKMEKEMLAVGGNAEAIIAGLMTNEEIQHFVRVLEKRRKKFKLRTVSFTLIPPYPEGFFLHHACRHPWHYQNGGEWDWIGGRLVNALFQVGFRQEALHYLKEILQKNLKNLTIFEWEDRQGTGQGALFYAGAAGVIGEAIIKGYFGLGEDILKYQLKYHQNNFGFHVSKDNINMTIYSGNQEKLKVNRITEKKICVQQKNNKKTRCLKKIGTYVFE